MCKFFIFPLNIVVYCICFIMLLKDILGRLPCSACCKKVVVLFTFILLNSILSSKIQYNLQKPFRFPQAVGLFYKL